MHVVVGAPDHATRQVDRGTAPRATARGWILACVAAECIGMTASASAARASEGLPSSAALALIVKGGLIEGIALGVLQAVWLGRRFQGLSRLAWIGSTVLIAGVGWALASAPSVPVDTGGTAPSPAMILVMAAGLGLAMGALLGAGQALVLRLHVRHPWRWVTISAVAWAPAMVLIFASASAPDASWPTAWVIALGALTGAVAGAVIGLVSISLMPTLTGRSIGSGVLAWLLQHRAFRLGATLALLRVRNRPAELSVWMNGRWQQATGQAITGTDARYPEARNLYRARWPRVPVAENAILTHIELHTKEQSA